MGRHTASSGTTTYVGYIGGVALAIGVGAAIAGAGSAYAETSSGSGPGSGATSSSSAHSSPGPKARNTKQLNVSHTATVERAAPLATPARASRPRVVVRPTPNPTPSTSPGYPTTADEAPTAYGDIGKWMLQRSGQIANYGGQQYGGKTLLEPVNVIIVDPTSTTSAQAKRRLNAAMFWSGFPGQPVHSTGFQGTIDDVTYGQQPTGSLQSYSDNLFLLPNDHGRIFGPDPVQTSTGYVWSGAFSTETVGFYNGVPAHLYVSSDMARTALAMRLIASGQATYFGMVPLNNAYNTDTTTTGDHDGYAVVLKLR